MNTFLTVTPIMKSVDYDPHLKCGTNRLINTSKATQLSVAKIKASLTAQPRGNARGTAEQRGWSQSHLGNSGFLRKPLLPAGDLAAAQGGSAASYLAVAALWPGTPLLCQAMG